MSWTPNFPTGPTLINQFMPIVNNWAFLATTIGQDHVFNTLTSGTHKWVNLANQSPNPAVDVNSQAIEFTRTMGPVSSPTQIPSWMHFKNTSFTYRHTLGMSRQHVAPAGVYPQTRSLFAFTASVDGPIAGTFFVYEQGFSFNAASIDFIWDGTLLTPIPNSFGQTGNILALGLITPGNTTIMEATVSSAATYNWAFNAIPFGT